MNALALRRRGGFAAATASPAVTVSLNVEAGVAWLLLAILLFMLNLAGDSSGSSHTHALPSAVNEMRTAPLGLTGDDTGLGSFWPRIIASPSGENEMRSAGERGKAIELGR